MVTIRRKLEEQRLQREEQRLQRQLQERKWQEELELKRSERRYRDSTAVKVKTWGDALRNVTTKINA